MKTETISKQLFSTSSNTGNSGDSLTGSFFRINDKSFAKAIKETSSPLGIMVLISTFLLMIAGAFLVYKFQSDFDQFHIDRINSTWGYPFLVITTVFFLFKTGVFLFNLFLYFKYKPIESVTDELLPTCTIIVPAYNEGKLVWDTLVSLADSDYPEQKMQILAIDDGSKDDTWYWMQQAKVKLGDRLSIYQQPKNQGKRHALHRGFNLGNGEIFVTVDSDSVVKKDTVRNLVSPFITNKNCGAVAGNVLVLNNKKAILPKMLNVSFVMSFEFMRSAESVLGSVLCTPGALAAYRSDAVFACLPEWIDQTFMGQPSDIGEDRAMTNMILKQGHEVLFQRNSYVLTNVPENYTGLYKMFIRWGRSNVRENLMMAQYVFKDFRKGSKFGTRLLFIDQSLKIVMAYPFMLFMLFFIVVHPLLFLGSTLLSILIVSSFSALFYAKRHNVSESFWAYSYSVFYTFGLFWITPYAIITANKRGWLTRGLSEVK
ncbi:MULTISPECIES: glycosyltransferase family 2 protein [unclassified Flavobacterium]|uniref:glycosyltransferase n=1 Tax=unclassified Flavobacterium TaxID=196869 RepID=UPI000580880E|nr:MULTISPECIES: glycosyltransferase family 2 protein [unclassified Flavobacterium]KIA97487.1 glycosyl transferase family 2 [Flavobacterium sp. KMS]KIA98160.1 glycosyl transferase family 2 [Flavobacterium sp. JRM]MEA9414896.1 glycosyltransferase family 2 protein [Flavobacterium sp. PL02]OUL61061.1 glycosyl transferase family 2 [Flavobacterium sp. AJR]